MNILYTHINEQTHGISTYIFTFEKQLLMLSLTIWTIYLYKHSKMLNKNNLLSLKKAILKYMLDKLSKIDGILNEMVISEFFL